MTHGVQEFESDLLNHVPQLRRRALNLSGNPADADDLVQETLIRAWRHRRRFRHGSNLAAWLMTILRNCFLSEKRRLRRARVGLERFGSDHGVAEPRQIDALSIGELARDIGALPDEQRRPLLMVSLSPASYAETAERCGCTVGTVKSRVSRARRSLAMRAAAA